MGLLKFECLKRMLSAGVFMALLGSMVQGDEHPEVFQGNSEPPILNQMGPESSDASLPGTSIQSDTPRHKTSITHSREFIEGCTREDPTGSLLYSTDHRAQTTVLKGSTNFSAFSYFFTLMRPPDPTLAVGPAPNNKHWIVHTVNSHFGVWDASGVNLKWQPFSGPGSFFYYDDIPRFIFDPKCLYDQDSGEFFVVAVEQSDGPPGPKYSRILLAVSQNGNPDTFIKYHTDAMVNIGGIDTWADYPGLGVDKDAVYVITNQYKFPKGSATSHEGILYRIFNKSHVVQGSPNPQINNIVIPDTSYASVQGAHVFGTDNFAPYFVSAYLENPSTRLRVEAIPDPLSSNPQLNSWDVAVDEYYLPSAFTPSGAEQLGHSTRLDVLDGRMINAVWRNGFLYAAHAIRVGPGASKNRARWYQIKTYNWPQFGSKYPIRTKSGNIGGTRHTWFPTITVNANEEVGLVMAGSSGSQHAGIYLSGRSKCDPDGYMAPLKELFKGNDYYIDGVEPNRPDARWGDYFGIAVDPYNDDTFWATGEWPSFVDNQYRGKLWFTQIGNFDVLGAPCRTLSVDSSPVQGVEVTVSPLDGNADGDGTTPFNRIYGDGTPITLEVKSEDDPQGYHFFRWTLDGNNYPPRERVLEFTVNGSNLNADVAFLQDQASWQNYGQGWPGTHGVPSLVLDNDPVIATSITLSIGNSWGQDTTGTLVLGYAAGQHPTGLGGTLWIDPPYTFNNLAIPAAGLSVPYDIPDDPMLSGVELYLQVLEQDPGASHGTSFTEGLQMTFGA